MIDQWLTDKQTFFMLKWFYMWALQNLMSHNFRVLGKIKNINLLTCSFNPSIVLFSYFSATMIMCPQSSSLAALATSGILFALQVMCCGHQLQQNSSSLLSSLPLWPPTSWLFTPSLCIPKANVRMWCQSGDTHAARHSLITTSRNN